MKRRSLILAALLAPLASCAQTRKSATIGYIAPASETVVAANLHALREGLRQRGYVLGGNLRMEPRYARGQMDRIATFASELANLPADVLVTVGSHVTRVRTDVCCSEHFARQQPDAVLVFSAGLAQALRVDGVIE